MEEEEEGVLLLGGKRLIQENARASIVCVTMEWVGGQSAS